MKNIWGSNLWDELTENVKTAMEKSLETLKTRDVENIPGAKEQLIRRFEQLIRFLPQEHGQILIRSIDDSISNSFFPHTRDLAVAFQKILESSNP